MNEDTHYSSDDQSPDQPEKHKKRSFVSVGDAMEAGKTDGAAKAREKGPEFKSNFAEAVHDLAYSVAFGSTFAGAFLNEMIPESVRAGFANGAHAGREAGRQASEKASGSFHSNPESTDGPNPSSPTSPNFS